MSEPLSKNDIEDVVSSVRRLVSPEARPRPLSRDLGLEKLLLTPALQVVSEPAPAPKAQAKARAKPETATSSRAKASTPKPDPIRANPAATAVEAEWEAPFWSEPETALAELALQAEEAVLVAIPDPDAAAAPAAVTRKPRARQPASAKKPAPAKPANSRSAPAHPVAKTAKPQSAKPKPGKSAAKPAPVAVKPALELVRSEPEKPKVEPLLLVASVAMDDLPSSPVEAATDLRPAPELVSQTAAPVTADAPLVEELLVNGLSQVLTDRDGNPVSLLDEDELILMVRRVIRQELQEVLGERITRNIRKLVRAEINRALTSQTLE